MMKKVSSLLAFAVLATFFSCEKIKDFTTFNINSQAEVKIPAQTGLNMPIVVRSPEINTSSEQVFKNHNTSPELVESAFLNQVSLSIVAPETQNFNFLNEINLFIKDGEGNEALLASKKGIPESSLQILELETSGTNLKPFIQKGSFTIRTDAITDQVVDTEIEIKVEMTFTVSAKVF